MAITLVGISATVTGINCAPTIPANVQQGDLLITVCLIGTSGTAAQIMPGPWERFRDDTSGAAPSLRLNVWSAFYGSATMPTTVNTQGNSGRAFMVAYRGAGGVDTSAATASTSTATITYPTVSPRAVNEMCVFIWATSASGSNGAISGSDPTPTEELDEAVTLGFADGIHTSATATGARTSTNTATTTVLGTSILLFEDPNISNVSYVEIPANQRYA